jgi:hypothetical protein
LKNNASITRIKAVYHALDELKDKVVFVGGATVSLYADLEIIEPRPTDDVDVIIEILNYKERVSLEEKLRSKGFVHDAASGIVCRYTVKGITVDVMPINDPSIGFYSRWHEEGFHEAIRHQIDDLHIIRILSAPFFMATKLEAFESRGHSDGRTSQDFEDIVFVLEQRANVWKEMISANSNVRQYLNNEFIKLRSNTNLFEWIEAHVERNTPRATRRIMKSIDDFIH